MNGLFLTSAESTELRYIFLLNPLLRALRVSAVSSRAVEICASQAVSSWSATAAVPHRCETDRPRSRKAQAARIVAHGPIARPDRKTRVSVGRKCGQ